MPWITRGGRRYWYRREKIGNRWQKVYVGTGPAAEVAAQCDAARKQQRADERDRYLEERQRYAIAEAIIVDLDRLARVLSYAALLTAGYHRHDRGPWRKRRRRR